MKFAEQRSKIDSLISSGGNNNDSVQVIENLQEAILATNSLQHDSLRMVYYNKIAFRAATKGDSTLFLKSSAAGLRLARLRRDSIALGYAHWNYGMYYLNGKRYDSSYAHYRRAFKWFEHRNNFYAGKMLYNMAFISGRLKDYTLSEMLLYKAIKLFEAENKYTQLYLCYNHLGVIYKNLEEYSEALAYYEKARNYWEKSEKHPLYLFDLLNNIGVVNQKIGNQEEALKSFDAALGHRELKKMDPALYARVIDNRAYSLMLEGETENPLQEFHKALKVRDSIGNEEGRVMSYMHLARYYLKLGEMDSAKKNATIAFEIAHKINLRRDALESLLLLAKANPEEQLYYLQEHIKLNEQLNKEERGIRNKFARIQFETESYIDSNKRLVKTRLWIVVGSLLSITILVLTVILIRQRAHTKALEFETRQQLADEKIYLLTLKEQANLERGMFKERRRISEELHDGILGRLLAIRVNWERLHLEGEAKAISEHQNLLFHLGQVEKEIRAISHDLQNEIMLIDTRFVRWMEKLTKDRARIGNFEYIFYADSLVDWEGFDDYFKTNMYRILEEALQNCIKHAGAILVKVSLLGQQEFVLLEVADNGCGLGRSPRGKGIGIRNMESRANKLDGILSIKSGPSEGTTLTVKIPNYEKL